MTIFYKVADHLFRLILPDDSPLCRKLSQYEPFKAEEDGEPVFTVEVVGSVQSPACELVYGGSSDPAQPLVKLYKGEKGWMFEVAPYGTAPIAAKVVSDSGFNSAKVEILNPTSALFGLNNALMLMFAFRTASLGTLELHASVIVNRGRAFLWMAASGTGKSTHSGLWLKYVEGSSLLNDDNPIVRVFPDGSVVVYGSPWSGKTPCYKNEHYPLGAFVRIRRCSENNISRLSVFEAYALLYSSSSGFKGDPLMAARLHESFELLATSSPCYVLDCRPDEDAARVSSSELLALYE